MDKINSIANSKTKFKLVDFLLIVLLIVTYSELRNFLTARQLDVKITDSETRLKEAIASSSAIYTTKSADLDNRISMLLGQSNNLFDVLNQQQSKTDIVAAQVGSVFSTVDTLDKLSKTDTQLLQKYSKVFFLNEHYTPAQLVNISSNFIFGSGRTLQFNAGVWPRLESLLKAANAENTNLLVESAYRSFATQAVLKSNYKVTYGAGTANQFSADQGYSEHQLGTTVDFTTPTTGSGLTGFETTSAYTWLLNNAHKYGFVLSYPKNNKYYIFEPWHWRYVGIDLANKLYRDGKNFYDMDQREINNYLSLFFS